MHANLLLQVENNELCLVLCHDNRKESVVEFFECGRDLHTRLAVFNRVVAQALSCRQRVDELALDRVRLLLRVWEDLDELDEVVGVRDDHLHHVD